MPHPSARCPLLSQRGRGVPTAKSSLRVRLPDPPPYHLTEHAAPAPLPSATSKRLHPASEWNDLARHEGTSASCCHCDEWSGCLAYCNRRTPDGSQGRTHAPRGG